jgi:hypothetical protein
MSCNCWHGLIIKDNGDVEKCTRCNKELSKHELPNSVRIVKVVTPIALSFAHERGLVYEGPGKLHQQVLDPLPKHVERALAYTSSGYFYARLEPNDTWTILNRIEDQEW